MIEGGLYAELMTNRAFQGNPMVGILIYILAHSERAAQSLLEESMGSLGHPMLAQRILSCHLDRSL